MAEQRWQRDAAGCSGLSNADDEEALTDLANMTSAGTLGSPVQGRSGPTIEAGSLAGVTASPSANASNVQVERVWAALMQDTQPGGNSLGTNAWAHREMMAP